MVAICDWKLQFQIMLQPRWGYWEVKLFDQRVRDRVTEITHSTIDEQADKAGCLPQNLTANLQNDKSLDIPAEMAIIYTYRYVGALGQGVELSNHSRRPSDGMKLGHCLQRWPNRKHALVRSGGWVTTIILVQCMLGQHRIRYAINGSKSTVRYVSATKQVTPVLS